MEQIWKYEVPEGLPEAGRILTVFKDEATLELELKIDAPGQDARSIKLPLETFDALVGEVG